MNVEIALDIRAQVGEGAIWDDRRACLWWVDIVGKTINAFDPATGANRAWRVSEMPGCLALTHGTALIVALEHRLARFDPETGNLETITVFEDDLPDNRANDGAVCRKGRFHFGTMSRTRRDQADGRLWQFDGAHRARMLQGGIHVTNGLAFSPENRTAYVSDSYPDAQGIRAYDYDPDTGDWTNGRLFFDTHTTAGRPDGACIDADGCYWMAGVGGGELLRLTPDGAIDRRIAMPVPRPSRPCFGGARLDTLYVTSIGLQGDLSLPEGAVFALRPGVTGLPEPRVDGGTQR